MMIQEQLLLHICKRLLSGPGHSPGVLDPGGSPDVLHSHTILACKKGDSWAGNFFKKLVRQSKAEKKRDKQSYHYILLANLTLIDLDFE